VLAYVVEENHAGLTDAHPAPQPAPGYVRVRTLTAGICNTDLELVRGYMAFRGVLGHEFVGEAMEGKLAGRRVVGSINFGCGTCRSCQAGLARHCPQRKVLGIVGADGVMAEEFVIPESNLLVVPDSVGDEEAVFTEPLAAACEILDQLSHLPRERALVMGDGKLGLLICQVLALAGFHVDLVGHHLENVAWVEDAGVRRVGTLPRDGGYPLVVEATGSNAGLTGAIAATAPRGTLVLKTTVAGKHEVDLAPIVINEITLVGSRCGRFEPALDLLGSHRIQVRPLIETRYGLRQADEAFRHAGRPGARKIIVRSA